MLGKRDRDREKREKREEKNRSPREEGTVKND
jgi:hypothetical protein